MPFSARSLLLKYMPTWVKAGWSASEALSYARSGEIVSKLAKAGMSFPSGIGIRETDFRKMYRSFYSVSKQEEVAKYIPRQHWPPLGLSIESPYVQSDPYLYVFKVNYRDPETGELKNVFKSTGLKNLEREEDAWDQLEGIMERYDQPFAASVEGRRLQTIYRKTQYETF